MPTINILGRGSQVQLCRRRVQLRRSRSPRCRNKFCFLNLHPPRHPHPRRSLRSCRCPLSLRSLTKQTFKSPAHNIVFHSAGILDPDYHPISSTPLAIQLNHISQCTQRLLRASRSRQSSGTGWRWKNLYALVVAGGEESAGTRAGVYMSSKAAVEAMVKSLVKELEEKRITVNCIASGPGEMDMYFAGTMKKDPKTGLPMGRVEPVVGFLSSDWGEWINGQVIGVKGGIY